MRFGWSTPFPCTLKPSIQLPASILLSIITCSGRHACTTNEPIDQSRACVRAYRRCVARSQIRETSDIHVHTHTHQLVPWLQHIYGHKICHQTSRLAGRNSCLQALVIRSATHKPMDGPLASTSIVLWWGGCNLELSHSRRSIRRREPTYKSNVGTSPLFFVLQNNRRSASTILLLDIG
jgi:hypothetical protein